MNFIRSYQAIYVFPLKYHIKEQLYRWLDHSTKFIDDKNFIGLISSNQ